MMPPEALATMDDAPQSPAPERLPCPRCGYDLSGTPAAWIEHCPLHGTCSECGAQLVWNDLLGRGTHQLPGFVEQARSSRETLRCGFTTLATMMLPERYWSRIGTRFPWNPGPVLYLTLAFVIALTATTTLLTTGLIRYAGYIGGTGGARLSPSPASTLLAAAHTTLLPHMTASRGFIPALVQHGLSFTSVLGAAIAWPLMLRVTAARRHSPQHRAQLDTSHLLRAATMQTWPLLIYFLAATLLHSTAAAFLYLTIMGPLQHASELVTWITTANVFAADLCVPVLLVSLHLWLGAWWAAAIRTGWKLQHARRLWGTLWAASLFVGVVVHSLAKLGAST